MARLLAPLLLGLLLPVASLSHAKAYRVTLSGFGAEAVVEILGLDREAAADTIQEVAQRLSAIEDELQNPSESEPVLGVPGLNRLAGEPSVRVGGRLLTLLSRSLELCNWSDGAYGPLGGQLYDLAGRGVSDLAVEWRQALDAAGCESLAIDRPAERAQLASGCRIDLLGLERGLAVDEIVEMLQSRGVLSGRVRLGSLVRAFGPGPEGRGWRIEMPDIPELKEPLSPVRLRDQALAFRTDPASDQSTGASAALLDLRTGTSPKGLEAVFVVTGQALDAQGLASALFILGSRQGQFRLGQLLPPPSALWLLGSDGSAPLFSSVRWSALVDD